jgi:hypothetical protein
LGTGFGFGLENPLFCGDVGRGRRFAKLVEIQGGHSRRIMSGCVARSMRCVGIDANTNFLQKRLHFLLKRIYLRFCFVPVCNSSSNSSLGSETRDPSVLPQGAIHRSEFPQLC